MSRKSRPHKPTPRKPNLLVVVIVVAAVLLLLLRMIAFVAARHRS
jgi:hypothetical protein